MCSAAAMVATTIVSTALSMAGQYEQQRVQEKNARNTAEYNAQVAENEAAMQQQLAQNEIAKGISDRERQQRHAARAMGEMRAGMGASGFAMDSGAMSSLLDESAIIEQNANLAAWQHLVGATSAKNNSAFARYQKQNASSGRMGTYIGMGGSLLGGISSAVNGYDAWKKSETPKGKK